MEGGYKRNAWYNLSDVPDMLVRQLNPISIA